MIASLEQDNLQHRQDNEMKTKASLEEKEEIIRKMKEDLEDQKRLNEKKWAEL